MIAKKGVTPLMMGGSRRAMGRNVAKASSLVPRFRALDEMARYLPFVD
jgi:hypothetical protein